MNEVRRKPGREFPLLLKAIAVVSHIWRTVAEGEGVPGVRGGRR